MVAMEYERDDDLPQSVALDFSSYEAYLDSQMTQQDLFYLEDQDLARQLVELGYRGSGETVRREEFEARRRQVESARRLQARSFHKTISSSGYDLSHSKLLQALAEREHAVRSGKITCIIFIRDRNRRGQEISGYIDYAHRLKTESFEPYFSGEKKLLPRPSDLSFYNWETQTCSSNATPNFQVIADNETGLIFKNKRDRKTVNVDPRAADAGDSTTRVVIWSSDVIQCAIFDHVTRRKA